MKCNVYEEFIARLTSKEGFKVMNTFPIEVNDSYEVTFLTINLYVLETSIQHQKYG